MKTSYGKVNKQACDPFKPHVIALKSVEFLKLINEESSFQDKLEAMRVYQQIFSKVSRAIIQRFDPTMVYTFNNEINVVFYVNEYGDVLFGGQILKLVTNIASFASNVLQKELSEMKMSPQCIFEGSFYEFEKDIEVANFLVWRQLDCYRNNASLMYKCANGLKDVTGLKHKDVVETLQKGGFEIDEFITHGTILKKQLYYVHKDDSLVARKNVIETYDLFSDNFDEMYHKYILNKVL
jgi:tRNA(His) 5'-end guanylyltransferase